jgi:hypothetical protein
VAEIQIPLRVGIFLLNHCTFLSFIFLRFVGSLVFGHWVVFINLLENES